MPFIISRFEMKNENHSDSPCRTEIIMKEPGRFLSPWLIWFRPPYSLQPLESSQLHHSRS